MNASILYQDLDKTKPKSVRFVAIPKSTQNTVVHSVVRDENRLKSYFIIDFDSVNENWDGYGAKAPSAIVIFNAYVFFNLLPKFYQDLLNINNIKLTPYGTIIMDWYIKNNYLSIEIGKTKVGFLTETTDGTDPFNVGIPFNTLEIPCEIFDIFRLVSLI